MGHRQDGRRNLLLKIILTKVGHQYGKYFKRSANSTLNQHFSSEQCNRQRGTADRECGGERVWGEIDDHITVDQRVIPASLPLWSCMDSGENLDECNDYLYSVQSLYSLVDVLSYEITPYSYRMILHYYFQDILNDDSVDAGYIEQNGH